MNSQDPKSDIDSVLDAHKTDLKEAISYLPPNYDFKLLCRFLKQVYGEAGKDIAREWIAKTQHEIPGNFDETWADSKLTSYRIQTFDRYIKEKLYAIAKETGWTPKALRHGEQSKEPPKMKLVQQQEEKIAEERAFEQQKTQIMERDKEDKSFVPPSIINRGGACYFHPYMKKEDIPDDEEEYISKLKKIVDCEVWVKEAVEQRMKSYGRQVDEIRVSYRLLLTNGDDKKLLAEVDHEDITTRIRFSSFLVSKGFVKFQGTGRDFNQFHAFLINGQDYPLVKEAYSWGEFEEGTYLFENGIYDVGESRFYPADEDLTISYGNKRFICPSGSQQVTPPRLHQAKQGSERFLAEVFQLWEDFNGTLNIRTTVGYAVAVIFSRELVGKFNFFPLLFNYGERGTGKSTSMDWFMALFGYRNGNRQSVSKQNTIKGITRRMTLPAYLPFFLDDYRNHENNSNAPDLTSPILNWFHFIGTGMAKKSVDNQTVDTPMCAPVVLTGNDKPTDSAVLDRLIVLNYTKFLDKRQQRKIKEIADQTDRLSEFTALILENYNAISTDFFQYIEKNRLWLADKGIDGRKSTIWGYILAGNQCLPHILPGLTSCHSDFKALRSEIYEKIKDQQAMQNRQAPLFKFFESLDFFATVKRDPRNKQTNLLDHRHFRFRSDESVADHNGEVTYEGPVLAIHMPRIWTSLQDVRVAITKKQQKSDIESMLANSKYYLAKSQQVLLTSGSGRGTSNLRCYYLSVKRLEKRGLLEGVIDKARAYENSPHAGSD
jgi:hypothetical protein